MLNEQAKKGLARILQISNSNDVNKNFESKFPGFMPNSKSEDSTKAVLKHVQKPSEILCQKHIRRDVIVTYLKEIGVHVQKEQSKEACIKACLHKWNVKDDNFWAKRPRSEERVLGNLPRLDNYMIRKTEVSSLEHCVKKDKLMSTLEPVQERNVLPRFKKKERKVGEEEVRGLSPAQVLTQSPTKKLSNTTEKGLVKSPSPVHNTTEQKRESTSFTASSRKSYDIFTLFGDLSNSSSESSDCFPAISKPERNQSISPSVPPHGSPAPMCHDNQTQSTSPSKTLNPLSSENFCSQMMNVDQPSTELSNFSPHSLDRYRPSMSTMGNEFKSSTDTPGPSSASIHWNYEVERELPELPSTQPFTISTEMDNSPKVIILEDDTKSVSVQPSASSVSSRSIYKEHEPSKVKHTSASKLSIRTRPVSNASVQTLLSEPPERPSNGFAVSQGNQISIWCSEKGSELSESHENPCPTKTLNHKRRLHEPPDYALSHHKNWNDYPLSPNGKDCPTVIYDSKRSQLSSPSNADYASAFRNINRSRPTFSKCPNCKRQYYSSSFLHADRKELDASPKNQFYKKKRPPSLSKEVSSPEKQRRLPMESKRAKGTSVASHVSRRSSNLMPKTKTGKRKYLTSSPSKETSPLHESRRQSTFSSEQPCYTSQRHKQSMLPFKKVNPKRKNSFLKPKNEDEDLSESSTDCLLPENPIDETTDPPPRSSSAPPKLLSLSKLKSENCSDTSDGNGNPPTVSPASPDLEKPLSRPQRRWCSIM